VLQQLEQELLQQRNALDLSSIRLTDVNDMKYEQEMNSEPRHLTPADLDLIFGDQTSTVF
jgi:hypothetical protein